MQKCVKRLKNNFNPLIIVFLLIPLIKAIESIPNEIIAVFKIKKLNPTSTR